LCLVFAGSLCATFFAVWILPRYTGINIAASVTETDKLLTRFETVWMIQATVTALVYPIVLAFVAVLLQRRPSAKATLDLYLLDTAALPASLSAATLVTVMGLEYLAVNTFGEGWLEWGLLGSLFWFSISGVLTVYFLYRTLRFLNDDQRVQSFERYAVHIALPREIRGYLFTHILLDRQKRSLLPGQSSYLAYEPGNMIETEPGPKVSLREQSSGEPCVIAG
jgi:hypothetical protein